MATLTTHCFIGQEVFPLLPKLDPLAYGSFLLGCMLVDVHILHPDYRDVTHFYQGNPVEKGYQNRSCKNFLSQLDKILVRPWSSLTPSEQAFAAGYLCHLAADEAWKQMDRASAETNGVRWWRDLSVPSGVTLTVFDLLLLEKEPPSVFTSQLGQTEAPDIFKHVPYRAFQALWAAVRPYVVDGGTPAAYFELSGRFARINPEFQVALKEYDLNRQGAVVVIDQYLNGLQARMDAMVSRSLEQVPRLWAYMDGD